MLLNRQYRGRVRLRYVDVDDPTMDSFPEVLDMLQARSASLPLLMVDGEAMPDAPVNWRSITRAIQARGIKEAV